MKIADKERIKKLQWRLAFAEAVCIAAWRPLSEAKSMESWYGDLQKPLNRWRKIVDESDAMGQARKKSR